MPEPTIYDHAAQLLDACGSRVTPERDVNLPAIQLSHWPIRDTALAACLGTLEIPFREPGPFTDEVDELSGERRKTWWMGEVSRTGGEKAHKTEELMGAWGQRARFEAEHPLHPLNAMRAAIDAREFWVNVIHTRGLLPAETRDAAVFSTTSIRDASILKASGFAPKAFNGTAFILSRSAKGVPVQKVLEIAARAEGASPAQWMRKALENFAYLLRIAKDQSPIIKITEGDQTLLLTADATPRTRDKFTRLL